MATLPRAASFFQKDQFFQGFVIYEILRLVKVGTLSRADFARVLD
jgi:hypothetical protein